jgi:hypothetical protein
MHSNIIMSSCRDYVRYRAQCECAISGKLNVRYRAKSMSDDGVQNSPLIQTQAGLVHLLHCLAPPRRGQEFLLHGSMKACVCAWQCMQAPPPPTQNGVCDIAHKSSTVRYRTKLWSRESCSGVFFIISKTMYTIFVPVCTELKDV